MWFVRAGSRPWLLLVLGLAAACSTKPPPEPGSGSGPGPAGVAVEARPPVAIVDARPAIPALAVDAPAPPPSGTRPPRFGVRWRAAVPHATSVDDGARAPLAVRGEVVVSHRESITAFDLATGELLHSVRLPHVRLVGDHDTLTAVAHAELLGVDPATLAPTWRAPASGSTFALGDWLVETVVTANTPAVQLRRASDGQVMWRLDEPPEPSSGAVRFVIGHTLYLQLIGRVAAIELASGQVRWRRPGMMHSASGDRVAIADATGHFTIVDADGHDRWTAACDTVVLAGDTAYATTAAGVTAVDLATNAVKWRRPSARAFAGDASWVYTWAAPLRGPAPPRLEVLAAATGELAARLPLTPDPDPMLVAGGAIATVNGAWVVALGPLDQPEPTHAVDARVCLIVRGCASSRTPLVGAAVNLGGSAAVTDRRGCFRYRGQIGVSPLELVVPTGSIGVPPAFDTPFPAAVVLDRTPVTLEASYTGGGCHDSSPGGSP
jgi:hypothetical protein